MAALDVLRRAPRARRLAPLPVPGGGALLEAHGLTVMRDGQLVVDHVDLALRPREIVTVIGLNGSGKTTLVRALLGLVKPAGGTLERKKRLRVGYVPQMLARDVTLPITVRRFIGLAGRIPRVEIEHVLKTLNIGQLAQAQLTALSGGELRRVLLARALVRRPELLVLDEPMSGVDVAGQAEYYRLIGALRRSLGCAVLLVSHDLHLVMAETDHVICLNHHVCCAGRPQAVVRDPSFIALFGREVAEALAVYRHAHDHVHGPAGEIIEAAPAPLAEGQGHG
jgi:zinc transport system ATP-binding protein